MEIDYDKAIESHLGDIIKQVEALRIAFVSGRLVFPDGEESGKDEILSHLDDVLTPLDTITSYYI